MATIGISVTTGSQHKRRASVLAFLLSWAMILPTIFIGVTAVVASEAPTAAAASGYPEIFVNSTGAAGAEPTIGISSSGALFVQNGLSTMRSIDGGKTWARVNPVTTGVVTLDPMLELDRVSDRLFVDQLYVACSVLAFTDSPDSATTSPADWVTQPFTCGQKVGQDHQKLAAGPLPASPVVPNSPIYDRAVYYAWSDVGTADFMVARSTDGGLTWLQGTSIAVGYLDRGVVGAMPSGIVYVDETTGYVYGEYPTNRDSHGVSVSKDGGATWSPQEITPRGVGHGGNTDGGIYSDANGHVYVAWWNDRDYQVYYSHSKDYGTTWSLPRVVSGENYQAPPSGFDDDGEIRSTIFPTLVAGGDGRVAVMYLGTEDSDVGPEFCDSTQGAGTDCRWRSYVTTIEGANTLTPEMTTYAVTDGETTAEKYVQIGSIHVGGGSDADRNLLDFNDIDVDNDGWPVMTFADGCTNSVTCQDDAGGRAGYFAKFMGFNLNGDSTPPPANPDVKITSPASGSEVDASTIAVEGIVDRDGGENAAPSASLLASPESGEKPLTVTFTIGASDADGAIASWTLDLDGDGVADLGESGAPPASLDHTYTEAGSFTARITVTDDEGATAFATATVTVTAPASGMPEPDGTIEGSLYAYNEGGIGASNVVAIITGETVGDDVPKYVAGETLSVQLRDSYSVDESVTFTSGTAVALHVYDSSGARVSGPIAMSRSGEEDPTLSGCPSTCYWFGTDYSVPATFEGRYFMIAIATVSDVEHAITVKPIDVLGAPTSGEAGDDDAGHTIGDPNDDATTPFTEVQWADVSLSASSLDVVVQMADVNPPNGLSPYWLRIPVAGLDLRAYVYVSPRLWDNTNGQYVEGATVMYDTGMKRIDVSLPRAYVDAWGTGCPCNVFIETHGGDPFSGVIADLSVPDDRAPDGGSVPLGVALPRASALARSINVPLSADDPEVEDPQDTGLAFMDIRKMWIEAETATTFDIVMKLEDLSGQPPSIDVGVAKAAISYKGEFCLDNNVNAASNGPLFCYRLSAVNSLPAPTFGGGVIQRDTSGSCNLAGLVVGGAFNVAADTVRWTLSRAALDVTQNSDNVGACTADPIVRGGDGAIDGTTLSRLAGGSGASAGAGVILTLNVGDTTEPDLARDYVFGASAPLVADAGGAYSGVAGSAIAITGTASGGTEPHACSWSGDGTFADASACATTVTFSAAGTHTITLTVTDAASGSATDTATVDVSGAEGERVDLFVDDEATSRASAPVSTDSGSPTASWSTTLDLSDLSGTHTVTAKWFDADGSLLDSTTTTLTVRASNGAFVTIDAPADDPSGDAPLAGSVDVSGKAGHAGTAGATALATTPAALRTGVVVGTIDRACVGCASPLDLQPLGASAAWAAGAPAGALDGSDGRWLRISGYGGAAYTLTTDSGDGANVWFFAAPKTPATSALAANVGAASVKTGVVPLGANWAFVALAEGAVGDDVARLEMQRQAGAPTHPVDLAAEALAGGIRVSWTAPELDGGSPVTGIRVYRDGVLVGTAAASAASFVDVGADADRAYTYRLAAVNAVGESERSAAASATPEAATESSAPARVTGVAVSRVSDTSARVSWSAVADDDVDHYRVFRGTSDAVNPATGVLVGTTTGTALVDASLDAGAAYWFIVDAVDAAHNAGDASAPASLVASPVSTETVTVKVDGVVVDVLTVDTTATDPVTWATTVDTRDFADGAHTITAEYADGSGGIATDSIDVHVSNGVAVAIDAPADGATVAGDFTASGTATTASGPVQANGQLMAPHAGLDLVASGGLDALDAAFASEADYLGLAPALDGSRVIHVAFLGDAPADLPTHLVPDGWELSVHANVELEPAIREIEPGMDLTNAPPREGPPLPAISSGIGPGTHIRMNRPDGGFVCTANFVWEDDAGNLYLGAAGHCFLPAGTRSTHGPDADYDRTLTRVSVCVANCMITGNSPILGTYVNLGEVAYARQRTGGAQVGHDFGIVAIPDSLRPLVRMHMPVWNGPVDDARLQLGDLILHYGHAGGLGHTFPTHARAGIGMGSNSIRWASYMPSGPGDSGSSIVTGAPTGDDKVVEGVNAAGLLTHISLLSVGVIVGTNVDRAAEMALNDAGMSIHILVQGDSAFRPPAAPENVEAFPGDGAASLQWTAPSDGGAAITEYTVRYGTASGDYTASVTTADTSATVEGLVNGQSYFFVVTATNARGEGPASAEVTATPRPDPTAPAAPTNLVATAGSTVVDLAWSAPDDGGSAITHYTVKYGTASGAYDATQDVAGTTTTVTGLTDGVTYFFVVTATNAVGEGPASAETSATPTNTEPPAAPTNLRAFGGDGEVHLAWDEPTSGSAITGYHVSFGNASGTYTESVTSTTTATTVTGLTNNVTYYFVVQAENANGLGDASAEAAATPTADDAGTYSVEVRVSDVTPWTAADSFDGTAWSHHVADVPTGEHVLEARLLHDGNVVATDAVTITVENLGPVADAGPDLVADEGSLVVLQGAGSDPDGGSVTFAWTQTDGPAVTLSGADSATASFVAPDVASDVVLTFALTVTDSEGATATDSSAVTLLDLDAVSIDSVDGVPVDDADKLRGTVDLAGTFHLRAGGGNGNEPPSAVITDVVVNGMTVTASGASSTDADGTIASYAWDLGDGSTASGADLAYEYPEEGSYTLTLTVTDDAGASGQAMYGPFVVTRPQAAFAVDAGDSRFVRVGDPVTLTATAFGADGDASFAWDLDGDGVAETPGQSVQAPTAGMAAGIVAFTVHAVDSASRSATDSVSVFLYEMTPVTHTFEEDVLLGVNDEDAGESGLVDGATYRYPVVVGNAERLDAELTWETFVDAVPDNPSGLAGGPNDFDLYAFGPDGAEVTRSADFRAPEALAVDGPESGTWEMEVRSYLVVDDRFTLTVTVDAAPANPIPTLSQLSDVCFESPTQLLEVAVTGDYASAAWDLDYDGEFDDASGLTATTSFAMDGTAHLARFRATTTDGLRATLVVAYRAATDCGAQPPVVVIAVADTGINPYHREFAGELVPYPELAAHTTADPAALGPGDTPVYHAVTGEILPFTKHPSSYITGFPADAPALELTLGGGNHKALDNERVWNRGHDVVLAGQWMWIPGTKIVAALDGTDDAAQNGANDPTPLYDDHGHGSSASSVAAGNLVGTCPKCLIAFIEGLNTPHHAYTQPWIDFVSVSGSPRGNLGFPVITSAADTKAAAERGQTISYAAGNGIENGFITPEQTYLPSSSGPDWVLAVGAIQKGPDSSIQGSGKPVDWSSWGAGNIPSACRTGYSNQCGFSGTSAATPIATGVMAGALLEARIAMGDGAAGQKTPEQAGGILQAVAVGDAIAGSEWLADGVLTRAELWDVAFHCASEVGTGVGFPGSLPRSPVDFVYAGYGIANEAARDCAVAALTAGGPVRDTPAADLFFEVDEAIRDALWGDWDGDGDGEPGGNHNSQTSLAVPGLEGLAFADVSTVEKATRIIRDAYAAVGLASDAPPPMETYYLHRDACSGGQQWMDRTFAAGREGGHGCAGLASTRMDRSWSSTVPTDAAFAAGSTVDAHVRAFGIRPDPALTMRGTLYADGQPVGSGEATVTVVSVALVTTPCHEWLIRFPTTTAIDAGAVLTFRAETDDGTGDVPMCYEGGAESSRVTITGAGEIVTEPQPEVVIGTPEQGAEIDPAAGAVDVSGTATFPALGAEAQRVYLRRDDCANLNSDIMYLSPVNAEDAGDGCALLAGAAAPTQDFVERYPLVDAELPVTLAAGSAVTGTLCFNTQGADPFELEVRVASSAGIVGTKVVSGVGVDLLGALEAACVDVTIPVSSATAGVELSTLVLEIKILRQGPIHSTSLDDPASFIDIPRAIPVDAADRVVQVAIDDPTFATGLLAVAGTDAWTASWDASAAAPGAHTIYARAGQGGEFGPFASVGVVVLDSTTSDREPAVEIQVLRGGHRPDPTAWQPATLDGESWTFAWDTTTDKNGAWDVHVRLLGDDVEAARDVARLHVNNAKPPKFTEESKTEASEPTTVEEESTVSFTVEAEDENPEDTLTYSSPDAPEGSTLDASTGLFTWTPTLEQAGTYTITFEVTDGTSTETDTLATTIEVVNVNLAPTLDTIGPKTVGKGDPLTFVVTATDPDGDALTFGAPTIPAGATFDAATATFTWTPTADDLGNHSATFDVTDGQYSDAETINIRVVNLNHPPTLDAVGSKSTNEAATLAFAVSGTDPDGDAVTYSATGLPAGATFDATTGAFSWTPTYAQAGTYSVTFGASDGEFTDTEAVSILVANVNRAPSIGSVAPITMSEGDVVTVTPTGSDPDGEALEFTATDLPAGASFVGSPKTVQWRPTYDQAGAYEFTVTASDGELTATTTVTITVEDANRAPTVSLTVDDVVGRGQDVTFTAAAADADGDALTYAWDFGDGTTSADATPVHAYSAGGTHTVTLTVSDGRGGTATATGDVRVDDAAPHTTATVTGTNVGEWWGADAEVVLAATDALAGVASTEYALNDNTLFATYAAPIAVPDGEGEQIVKFRSVDNVGNEEVVRSVGVKVDTVAPNVRINLARPTDVVVTPANLSADANDGGSGVARVDFLVDDVLVCSDVDGADGWTCWYQPNATDSGRRTLTTKAYDRLGNVGEDSLVIYVVAQDPETIAAVTEPAGSAPIAESPLPQEAPAGAWLCVGYEDRVILSGGSLGGDRWLVRVPTIAEATALAAGAAADLKRGELDASALAVGASDGADADYDACHAMLG